MSTRSSKSLDCGARYSEGRLRSDAGYDDFPHIFTAMSFDLRQLPRISSRILKVEGHVFELWSPNSKQIAYLPGVCKDDFNPTIPSSLSSRHYDGHAGKHDCMVVPQYYRDVASHWPFMRRPTHVLGTDPARVAFARLTDYWESNRPGPSGRIRPSYIDELERLSLQFDWQIGEMRALFREGSATWKRRPLWANADRFAKLRTVRVWATAVDLGIALQRSVREKEAWIRFYLERRRMMGYRFDDLCRMRMPEADDTFVGFWANGSSEKTVLHLMATKVPCFIVHEYPGGTPPRPRTDIYTSFMKNTIVELYVGSSNPYDRLAAAEPTRLHAIFDGNDGRGTGRLALATEEMRSSSVYLQSLGPLEDVIPYYRPGTPPPAPAEVPTVYPPTLDARPMAATRRKSTLQPPKSPKLNVVTGLPKSAAALTGLAWGASGWNSTASDSLESRSWGDSAAGAHSAGEALGNAATSATVVPAVGATSASGSKPSTGNGATTNSLTDRYAAPPIEHRRIDPERFPWVVPPAIATPPPKGKWQKWELDTFRDGKAWLGKEQKPVLGLYMRDSFPPPGVINDGVFGRPVPRYPFLYESGENVSYKAAPHRASHWMYRTRAPVRGDAGRTALEPSARELPRLPGYPARENAGQIVPEPAPSPVQPDDEESDIGGGESDSGDDRPDDDPPSAILCVSGVGMDLSAGRFVTIARDAFFRAGARPQTAVGTGGQIWMSFGSINEARRARGTLIGLSEDIVLNYGLADRFMRTWNSSTDRWQPETMMDVDETRVELAPTAGTPVEQPSVPFASAAPLAATTQPVVAPAAAALPPTAIARVASPAAAPAPEVTSSNEPVGAQSAEEEYPDLFPVAAPPMAPLEQTVAVIESDVVMNDATTEAELLYLPRPFLPSSQAHRLAAPLPPRPLVPLPTMPSPPMIPSLAERLTNPTTTATALADRISGRALLDRLTEPRLPLADRLTDPSGGNARPRRNALEDRLSEATAPATKKRPRKLRKPAAPAPVTSTGEPLGDGEEETRKRGGRGGKRKRRNHAEADARRERRRLREEEAQQMHIEGVAVQQAGGGDELLEMAEAFQVANAEEALEDAVKESLGADGDITMEDATGVWSLHDDDDPPIAGGSRF
ncbi:hypothetical protein C8R43DRAFT_1128683 [Mycena crocata]|nr:hypothetical protein C8R43DRAFT_1128683 [Mycena crocata]